MLVGSGIFSRRKRRSIGERIIRGTEAGGWDVDILTSRSA